MANPRISSIEINGVVYDIRDKRMDDLQQEEVLRIKQIHITDGTQTAKDILNAVVFPALGDIHIIGAEDADKEEYVYTDNGWERIGGIGAADVDAKIAAATAPITREVSTLAEHLTWINN